jgi:exosome complex component RRP43
VLTERTFKKLLPLDFLRRHLEYGIRTSGRSLLESRQATVSHINLSSTTFGTVVRMGDTSLVCSISAELCEPTVENPQDGYIGLAIGGKDLP